MGSASVSPTSSSSSNLSDVLQTLSAASPELSSLLSSPTVQASLAKASPGDIVKLSDAALELQNVDVLFGDSGSTQPSDSLFGDLSGANSSTQTDPLLAALDASLTEPAASALASTSSAASSATATSSTSTPSAAQAASNAQAQELAALFGTSTSSDPLVNVLG